MRLSADPTITKTPQITSAISADWGLLSATPPHLTHRPACQGTRCTRKSATRSVSKDSSPTHSKYALGRGGVGEGKESGGGNRGDGEEKGREVKGGIEQKEGGN